MPKSSIVMTFKAPVNKFCAVFGHNYKLVSKINKETSELVCKCCNNHFISSSSGNITSLSINK